MSYIKFSRCRVGNLLPTRFYYRVGFQPTTDTAGVVVGWAFLPTVTAEYIFSGSLNDKKTTPIGVVWWARMPTLRLYFAQYCLNTRTVLAMTFAISSR
ncbi:MAG: hypothetical protein IKZ88_07445 [Neisseriaceae bacterium]|nr:hypothetical protein [Neisseriaceae bacterium]